MSVEENEIIIFINDAFQSYYDLFQVNWLVQNYWYLYSYYKMYLQGVLRQ